MNLRQASTSSTSVRALLAQCERDHLNPDEILILAGIDRQTVADPDGRIPLSHMGKLVDTIMDRTSDHAFALHAAENLPMGEFGVVDFIVSNAPNLKDGLLRLCDYFPLLTDMCSLSFEESKGLGWLKLDMTVNGDLAERFVVEFTFGCTLSRSRTYFDQPLSVHSLCLRYDEQKNSSHLKSFFKTQINYGFTSNALVFDLGILESPLLDSNPYLSDLLEKLGEEKMSRFSIPQTISSEVRALLRRNLSQGENLSLKAVAQELGMSGRTLQRRLSSEGNTFKDILEALRRHWAFTWLKMQQMSIDEISYLLGFSEPSAFHRAFKRWTGMTPKAFRQRPAPHHVASPIE